MFRFGASAVDIAARVVERDGEVQHLEPQAFDLLAYLLTNAERVISKEELFDEVWGDQFVSESALTTRIKEVRRALGDDGVHQAVIKNFRGRGYRFVAALSGGRSATGTEMRSATRVVGRAVDFAETMELLTTSSLVTLVGPGGVGKTTLAEELARRSSDRFTDGVIVVRLAQVTDPASVVHVVRRDSGLVDTGSDYESLVAALSALDALVVVDNCEHLLDAVSRLAADVLALDGRPVLLATSRERLGVAGEQVWPVAPLNGEAARELLLDRARATRPGFGWTHADELGVDRILCSVDRLPLAIEMVAARLPMIGVGELADALVNRLDLLRSVDRSADERHRTIDALIGWSESLLDDDERDLLATMSVFAGPVPASDIASVAGVDPTELIVGPLAALVDKSLAVADVSQTPTSYRLLETVRASAARRRQRSTDERHARYVTAVATTCDHLVRTPDEPEAVARFDALLPEVRAAHAWARSNDLDLAAELTVALLWYANERQWAEPATWARAIDAVLVGDADLAVAASLAADASNRSHYVEAERLADRAATSGDPRVAGAALGTLIDIGLYTGDLDAARHHADSLTRLGTAIADRALQTIGAVDEVLSFVYDSRLVEAQQALDRLDTITGLGPTSSAWIAYAEGELLSASDRHDEAIERFNCAIRLGKSVGSHFVAGVAQVSLLAATARTGDVKKVLVAFRPVLIEYRRMRSDSHGVTTLRNLIEALVSAGRYEPAMELLGALSRPDIKATYGIESEHLDEARAVACAELGADSVERLIGRGAAHDLTWAFDHAIDVLDAIGDEGSG